MGMNRDMMARLQQMQERVLKAQQELNEQTVDGSAGGGAVSKSGARSERGDLNVLLGQRELRQDLFALMLVICVGVVP